MSFHRNRDLSKRLGVSDATIHYWIKDAIEKKNNLELIEINSKYRIADTFRNEEELQRLYQKGRDNLRSDFKKNITVSPDFLSLFTDEQLIEFISDIRKGEINGKFSYFGEGANIWDEIYREGNSRLQYLSETMIDHLWQFINPYLDNQLACNIFDVGVGNGFPLMKFIKDLESEKKLNKYYSIDISQSMNELAKLNLEKEINGRHGGYLNTDIETTSFATYFHRNTPENVSNIICLLGRTIGNISDRIRIFDNIARGMTDQDLFVLNFSLDTDRNKQDLNNMVSSYQNKLDANIPQLLGIEVDFDSFRTDFNLDFQFKYKSFRVNKEYYINFPVFNHSKSVTIPINSEIITWKSYPLSQHQMMGELNQAGLEVLSLIKDPTAQTALVICKIK